MRQLIVICPVLLLAVMISACTTTAYYTQAIAGQWSLSWSAKPVSKLIADPETSTDLKQQLNQASAMTSFARDRLALPLGNTFRRYAAFSRDYVVVNVVAVPEFALAPHQWCYLVVGCQSYRGYFDVSKARKEAADWRKKGYDTFIAGVTAYSTLGWFNDPLHSGFMRLPGDRMAALIFHELSHKVVYVAGDTRFNESFATAVELEGLRIWLNDQGRTDDFQRALERQQQRAQTLSLVETASTKLRELYASDTQAEEMRTRKAEILDKLREDYMTLAQSWSQPGPFGTYPSALNNAHIALFQQYNQYVPGFRYMLQQHGFDFEKFYLAVKALAQRPEEERKALLIQSGERFNEYL